MQAMSRCCRCQASSQWTSKSDYTGSTSDRGAMACGGLIYQIPSSHSSYRVGGSVFTSDTLQMEEHLMYSHFTLWPFNQIIRSAQLHEYRVACYKVVWKGMFNALSLVCVFKGSGWCFLLTQFHLDFYNLWNIWGHVLKIN